MERSDRVERAAEEDIMQAIFFSSLWEELVAGLSKNNILMDLKLLAELQGSWHSGSVAIPDKEVS